MTSRTSIITTIGVGLFCTSLAAGQSPIPHNKPDEFPAWWFQRNVIVRTDLANLSPDYAHPGDYNVPLDFAMLTQGQLKNFAVAAYDEFVIRGAGVSADMTALMQSWYTTDSNGVRHPVVTENTNNFAPVNLGQLKAVVKPFYDRFIAMNKIPGYPWTTMSTGADDYALANIGQAKFLFFFDLTQLGYGDSTSVDLVSKGTGWSINGQGLTNLDLIYGHMTFADQGGSSGDTDGDGLTNLEEARMGTDPLKKDNPAVKLTAFGFGTP